MDVPKHPITRVEARLKDGIPVNALASIPNLFGNLHIYSFKNLPVLDEQFKCFLMASQSQGGQNALLALTKPTRKKYKKYIDTYAAKWWQPHAIWQQWPSVIDSLLNPPVSHFKLFLKEDMAVAVGG